MRVIFASRHEPTGEQVADLRSILGGEVRVEVRALVWANEDEVERVADISDVLVGVFPQALALRIGYLGGIEVEHPGTAPWVRRVWTSETVPVAARDGEARRFAHVRFVGADGLDVRRPGAVGRLSLIHI